MRSVYVLVALSLVACKPSNGKDKGGVASTTGASAAGSSTPLPPFTSLKVTGPIKVDVTVGKPQAVAVTCANAVRKTDTTVEGSVLTIDSFDSGTCTATVMVPTLAAVEQGGTGTLTMHGKAAVSEIALSQSGSIVVDAIETDKLKLSLLGTGSTRIASLNAKATTIEDSSGPLELNGKTDTLDMKIMGDGSVKGSLTAKSMTIQKLGNGVFELAGKTETLEMKVMGGEVRSKGLVAEKLTLDITGSSPVALDATKKANVTIVGNGTATISGNPPERTKKVVGGTLKFE